jgi:hypothetical protein
MITAEQVSKLMGKRQRSPNVHIYVGLVSKNKPGDPIEGTFHGIVLDPVLKKKKTLKDIIIKNINTECIIERIETEDSHKMYKFFDKYYFL